MRIVASIEARMSSSRLPGKVLADVFGVPALTRLIQRLRASTRLDSIVLATTTNPADDVLVHWSRQNSVACFRGSEDDVLQRVVEAQRSMHSDITVEICGDCVLLDPRIIDLAVDRFLVGDCDVVTTTRARSFPLGQAVQVFRTESLGQVAASVDDPAVREHVSLFFYEHPEFYRTVYLAAPPECLGPEVRTHIDYPEDLEFVRELCRKLEPFRGPLFGVADMLALLRHNPELGQINSGCRERAAR